MKSKKIYFLLGIGFLILISAYVFVYLDQKQKEKDLIKAETITVSAVAYFGEGKIERKEKTLNNAGREEPYTAFDLVRELFETETLEYSWGISIKCIEDVCQDKEAGNYWFFWPNNEFSSVSLEKYYLKSGDEIMMKYQNSKEVGM